MQRAQGIFLNVIFFLQVLLIFLILFEDRLSLPPWVQVLGRLHPAMLHLPIGGLAFWVVLLFLKGQIKKKALNKITLIVLLLTSLAASVTALLGIFLAADGDYGADALTQHKYSGIALSFLCHFLLVVFVAVRESKILYYGTGLLTLGTVVFAGHTGSVLTHGENFVLAPLQKAGAGLEDPEASAFQQVIYPVLEKKCTTCHNRAKAKGSWVMTSMSEFQKGGKHGVEWVAGKPDESRMIQYIHLPLSDDDHMPPDGKPQLTRQEIKLLETWIAAGADVEKKLADWPEQDSFRIMGTAALAVAKLASNIEENPYSFSAASEETILKMNTPFRSVFPLYQGSPALQADFFIRESFKPSSLEELQDVNDQLVVLNLSKMPVTDNDLKVIGKFGRLEKLNLNFSKIDGSGLPSLQPLKNLASLSLAGTSVSAESLKPLLALSSLRELFVWNTKVTEEERATLAREHPNLAIFTSQFRDDEVLRLGKPIRVNEEVMKKGDSVILRHSMPGVTIRYTLDGARPDSVASLPYDKPIQLTATTTIKAIACRPGWYCSEVFDAICFVEGLKPTNATLLTKPDKQYPGEGVKSLMDGTKGFIDSFKEPAWLGYQNDPLAATFDFGPDAPTLQSIVVSYGRNAGSHIFPPEVVEVWAGRNNRDLTLIHSLKVAQPIDYDTPQLAALVIPLKASRHSYHKLILKPVSKLPAWHSAKGKKGWVFVDEIFFY
jgi:hypothetical protein